jgi:hypothetical protein
MLEHRNIFTPIRPSTKRRLPFQQLVAQSIRVFGSGLQRLRMLGVDEVRNRVGVVRGAVGGKDQWQRRDALRYPVPVIRR